MKGNIKNSGYLTFLILLGAISGTFIGEVMGQSFELDFLKKYYCIGMRKPMLLDLKILQMNFGINFNINLMTIVGIILVIIVYRKN